MIPMDNRIWEDGEGLSWSTINERIGEGEDRKYNLRDMVLDLSDHLFEEAKEHREIERQLKEAERRLKFLKQNLASCMEYGQRKLGLMGDMRYIHDKKPVMVSVKIENEKIEVAERQLSLWPA